MKKILFSAIALLLVAGGIVYFLGRDGTEELSDEASTPAPSATKTPATADEEKTGDSSPSPSPSPVPPPAPAPAPSPAPSPAPTPTPPSPAAPPSVKITYTDNGFTPGSATIQKGAKVIFENRSNRDVWPASAFHPTHALYPEKSQSDCLGSSFDACKGVPPGESWSFIFNKVGTWNYHNHLSAGQTGEVIVVEQ